MNKKVIYFIIVLLLVIVGIEIAYILINQSKNSNITKEEYNFSLDNSNKYEVTTDTRFKTMLNDGGSHTSIYYQIDLDKNIVNKVIYNYKANLMGTPSSSEKIEYTKEINNKLANEISTILKEAITKDDINDTNNYSPITLKTLNTEKNIYNTNTINNINTILSKIDDYNK